MKFSHAHPVKKYFRGSALFFIFLTVPLMFEGEAASAFIDPNPDLLDENGQLIPASAETILQAASDPKLQRTGVVTDGVSKLLLVFVLGPVPLVGILPPLSLEITSAGDGSDGTLSLMPGTSGTVQGETKLLLPNASYLIVDPQSSNCCFTFIYIAVYTPPADFDRQDKAPGQNARAVTISGIPLTLYRPPVLCVHGITATKATCKTLTARLEISGFTPFSVDYSDVNTETFDPARGIKGQPVERLIETIEKARKTYRDFKIAITQVDVVGHSMGGLVTRGLTKVTERPYRQKANFGQGDIRRLITVGTPHLGSELARFAQERMAQGQECIKAVVEDRDFNPQSSGFIDLAVDSVGLQNLNRRLIFEVATSTISGTVNGIQEVSVNSIFALIYDYFCKDVRAICDVGTMVTDVDEDEIVDCLDNCYRVPNPSQADRDRNGIGDACDFPDLPDFPPLLQLYQEPHDVLVGRSSQSGFIYPPPDQTKINFAGLVHSRAIAILKTSAEMENPDVIERILLLLNSPSSSPLFSPADVQILPNE